MPEICRFYGIVIAIFYSEHNPPHFHARYADQKASISIRDLAVIEGSLPPRAMGLVMEWATIHRDELMNAWERAMNNQLPGKIEPLS
jgi:phosphomannomutase